MVIVDVKDLDKLKQLVDQNQVLYLDTETIDLSKSIVPLGTKRDVRLIQLYQDHWTSGVVIDCFTVDIDEVMPIIDPCTWVMHNAAFDLEKLERIDKTNYVCTFLLAKAVLPLHLKYTPNPDFDPSQRDAWGNHSEYVTSRDGAAEKLYKLDNICNELGIQMQDPNKFIGKTLQDFKDAYYNRLTGKSFEEVVLLLDSMTGKKAAVKKFITDIGKKGACPTAEEVLAMSLPVAEFYCDALGITLPKYRCKSDFQESDWSIQLDELQLEYAKTDAEVLAPLYKSLMTYYNLDEAGRFNYMLNHRVTTMLLQAKREGIDVNKKKLHKIRDDASKELRAIALRFPPELNLKSNPQIAQFLGTSKADKDTMAQLAENGSEIVSSRVKDIMNFRAHSKTIEFCSKYLEKTKLVGNISAAYTITQRTSSRNENLQNIPRRLKSALGAIEGSGWIMISCDYPAIELRLATAIYGVSNFYGTMIQGVDTHTTTASAIFGIPYDQIPKDSEERTAAKSGNFGLLYGMGAAAFQKYLANLGIYKSLDWCKDFVQKWKDTNFEIRDMHLKVGKIVDYKNRGLFVGSTALGRTVKTHGYTEAMNYEVQGSGAELIKLSLVYMQPWLLENYDKVRLVATIHDANYLKVREDYKEEAEAMLRKCMTDAWVYMSQNSQRFIYRDIPLPLDVHVGYGME